MNKAIKVLVLLLVLSIITLIATVGYYEYQKKAHPLEYSEIVADISGEYNVDEFLVYAIIKTESGFNPKAVSDKGARGLMQIMPETFKWIKDYRLYDKERDFDDMFVPEHNIRYCTYLISYHMRHYNNVDNSLAAYHAGDGEVDRWLEDKSLSSDGEILNDIPFPDTKHYVKKVNKAYEIYKKLYLEN